MAVITLTSASGAPGVSTTALALAMSWPRPVLLVEADPSGGNGILSGFLRGTAEYEAGLIELRLSPLDVEDALRDVIRTLTPNVSYVCGVRSHTQATALHELWEPLGQVLAGLDATGQDVIVDAGRLGLVGSPQPLLEQADLTLLVTRTSLPALAAARSWAETVRNPSMGWRSPSVLVVGPGAPYGVGEVSKVLGLPVVADVPDDAESAAVYHRGAAPRRRFEAGRYYRGIAAAVESVQAHLARGGFELLKDGHR